MNGTLRRCARAGRLILRRREGSAKRADAHGKPFAPPFRPCSDAHRGRGGRRAAARRVEVDPSPPPPKPALEPKRLSPAAGGATAARRARAAAVAEEVDVGDDADEDAGEVDWREARAHRALLDAID